MNAINFEVSKTFLIDSNDHVTLRYNKKCEGIYMFSQIFLFAILIRSYSRTRRDSHLYQHASMIWLIDFPPFNFLIIEIIMYLTFWRGSRPTACCQGRRFEPNNAMSRTRGLIRYTTAVPINALASWSGRTGGHFGVWKMRGVIKFGGPFVTWITVYNYLEISVC